MKSYISNKDIVMMIYEDAVRHYEVVLAQGPCYISCWVKVLGDCLGTPDKFRYVIHYREGIGAENLKSGKSKPSLTKVPNLLQIGVR